MVTLSFLEKKALEQDINTIRRTYPHNNLILTFCNELSDLLKAATPLEKTPTGVYYNVYALLIKTPTFQKYPVEVLSIKIDDRVPIIHCLPMVDLGFGNVLNMIFNAIPVDKISAVLSIKNDEDDTVLSHWIDSSLDGERAFRDVLKKCSDNTLDCNMLTYRNRDGETILNKLDRQGNPMRILAVEMVSKIITIDQQTLLDSGICAKTFETPEIIKAVLNKYEGSWSKETIQQFFQRCDNLVLFMELLKKCPKNLLFTMFVNHIKNDFFEVRGKVRTTVLTDQYRVCIQLVLSALSIREWNTFLEAMNKKMLPGLSFPSLHSQEKRILSCVKACQNYLMHLEKSQATCADELIEITNRKIQVINDALDLLDTHRNDSDALSKFQAALCVRDPRTNRMILGIRRDSMLNTFLKAILVALTLGLTYHYFFGEKSIRGLVLISDMQALVHEAKWDGETLNPACSN